MHDAGSSSEFGAGFDAHLGAGSGADSETASVAPVVPVQRGVRDAARGEVLLRHARLASSGRPVFCTPSRAELAGLVGPRARRAAPTARSSTPRGRPPRPPPVSWRGSVPVRCGPTAARVLAAGTST